MPKVLYIDNTSILPSENYNMYMKRNGWSCAEIKLTQKHHLRAAHTSMNFSLLDNSTVNTAGNDPPTRIERVNFN